MDIIIPKSNFPIAINLDTVVHGFEFDLGQNYAARSGGYKGVASETLVGFENAFGANLDDVIFGSAAANYLSGHDGSDSLYGLAGNDRLYGGGDGDHIYGGAGNDELVGETGQDWLFGEAGNDFLNGSGDSDHLTGGLGRDTLWGGAGEPDFFYYRSAADSLASASGRDVIMDFEQGLDKIVLIFDKDTRTAGAQGFVASDFLGVASFTGKAGELRYVPGGGQTIIQADLNGDRKADFSIALQGYHALEVTDFVLISPGA